MNQTAVEVALIEKRLKMTEGGLLSSCLSQIYNLESFSQKETVSIYNAMKDYGFILTTKQDKNKYSEEDMKIAFEAGHKKGFSGYPNTENWKELSFKEWFENFKKK